MITLSCIKNCGASKPRPTPEFSRITLKKKNVLKKYSKKSLLPRKSLSTLTSNKSEETGLFLPKPRPKKSQPKNHQSRPLPSTISTKYNRTFNSSKNALTLWEIISSLTKKMMIRLWLIKLIPSSSLNKSRLLNCLNSYSSRSTILKICKRTLSLRKLFKWKRKLLPKPNLSAEKSNISSCITLAKTTILLSVSKKISSNLFIWIWGSFSSTLNNSKKLTKANILPMTKKIRKNSKPTILQLCLKNTLKTKDKSISFSFFKSIMNSS